MSCKKPFCKVCQDSGKPENVYTSHYVRSLPDKTGKTTVTCPTLLNTECRYCTRLGHTAKFCPIMIANKAGTKLYLILEAKEIEAKEIEAKEIEAKEIEAKEAEAKEAEAKEAEAKEVINPNSYAAILAKPIQIKEEPKILNPRWTSISKQETPFKRDQIVNFTEKKRSWADWSDSDDEDNIEFENYNQTLIRLTAN